jgi:hypothetical protein
VQTTPIEVYCPTMSVRIQSSAAVVNCAIFLRSNYAEVASVTDRAITHHSGNHSSGIGVDRHLFEPVLFPEIGPATRGHFHTAREFLTSFPHHNLHFDQRSDNLDSLYFPPIASATVAD